MRSVIGFCIDAPGTLSVLHYGDDSLSGEKLIDFSAIEAYDLYLPESEIKKRCGIKFKDATLTIYFRSGREMKIENLEISDSTIDQMRKKFASKSD